LSDSCRIDDVNNALVPDFHNPGKRPNRPEPRDK